MTGVAGCVGVVEESVEALVENVALVAVEIVVASVVFTGSVCTDSVGVDVLLATSLLAGRPRFLVEPVEKFSNLTLKFYN